MGLTQVQLKHKKGVKWPIRTSNYDENSLNDGTLNRMVTCTNTWNTLEGVKTNPRPNT